MGGGGERSEVEIRERVRFWLLPVLGGEVSGRSSSGCSLGLFAVAVVGGGFLLWRGLFAFPTRGFLAYDFAWTSGSSSKARNLGAD